MSESVAEIFETLEPVTVVTGHYGVGKTNLVLNLAVDAARMGRSVTVVDLDIVNPYFRSSDYDQLLEQAGITLIAPVFARSTLDTPSLTAGIAGAIERFQHDKDGLLLVDVGGDDVGATSLGRFAELIGRQPYRMIYVVNAFRNLTPDAEAACEILREIEEKSGLKANAIVNNSHMMRETKGEDVLSAFDFGQEVAACAHLPLLFTTCPDFLVKSADTDIIQTETRGRVYPVRIHVSTPWD